MQWAEIIKQTEVAMQNQIARILARSRPPVDPIISAYETGKYDGLRAIHEWAIRERERERKQNSG